MLLRHLSFPGPGRNRTGRRIVGGFASLPPFQEPSGQLALGGYDVSRLYHDGIFFDTLLGHCYHRYLAAGTRLTSWSPSSSPA